MCMPGRSSLLLTLLSRLQLLKVWSLQSKHKSADVQMLFWQAGDEVTQILRRGFFIELQSRFGNMFYVREEVSPKWQQILSAITTSFEDVKRGRVLEANTAFIKAASKPLSS